MKFSIDDIARLGDRTEAAVKTKSLLGSRILEVIPRGDGELVAPIPVERTTPPYQLADALGDLATTVDQLDTGHAVAVTRHDGADIRQHPTGRASRRQGTLPLLTVAQRP